MTLGICEVAGCSLRGKGHIRDNIPCQDKICSCSLGNVTAIALSDGASSGRMSHYGASRVAGVICRKLCTDFVKLMKCPDIQAAKKSVLEYLRHKLSLLALELGCDNDAIQSTLIAVASDGARYILLHIGDGIAGAFSENEACVMSEPYNDEIKTSTDCIFSPGTFRSMKMLRGSLADSGKNISGFVLMSDGAQAGYYDVRRGRFKRWLMTVRRKCFELDENLRGNFLRDELRDSADSSHTYDDCSIMFLEIK